MEFPDLQDQIRMDEERALSHHISDSDLRVLVIVKRPLLALRYMLPDGQIRKTQMNFVPISGCNIALETLKTAGLPVRDKDLPQVQGQLPQSSQSWPRSQDRPGSMNAGQQRLQSSQSQPQSQERPGSLNVGQSARPQSLHVAVPSSSRPHSQDYTGGWKTGYSSIPPSEQPTKVIIRPLSAPSGVNQDDFSRPIPASSRSTLDTFGSTTTVTTMPVVAKPRTKSRLLPSPVFNGTYEPFGSFQVRPMSAPEQVKTQQIYTTTLPLSQMLPPERTLPFPETKIHPCRNEEAASQEKPAATKTKAKKQTKPRAQPAKPKASKSNAGLVPSSFEPLAHSSPPPKARAKGKAPSSSAPLRIPPDPLVLPSTISRKRSLNDQSMNQSNKRQEQNLTETTTDTMTQALTTSIPEQNPQEQPGQATDLRISITNHKLLDTIDNLMRKYHDMPAPKPPPQTAKEHLAESAARSDEGRAKAIDNVICECLKDESFEMLMDNVEGAWKTIGLGFDERVR